MHIRLSKKCIGTFVGCLVSGNHGPLRVPSRVHSRKVDIGSNDNRILRIALLTKIRRHKSYLQIRCRGAGRGHLRRPSTGLTGNQPVEYTITRQAQGD